MQGCILALNALSYLLSYCVFNTFGNRVATLTTGPQNIHTSNLKQDLAVALCRMETDFIMQPAQCHFCVTECHLV